MTSVFSLVAVPSNCNMPLGLSVSLNDKVFFETAQLTEQQHIIVNFDDSQETDQVIAITLKNKNSSHTIVDDQGIIVDDSLILISNILLDGIAIDQLFYELSTYRHSYNSDNDPIDDKFFGSLGCNGSVIFKFSSPSYLWLLENM
jgi:hypothetical protein